jgi:hypothetical protein
VRRCAHRVSAINEERPLLVVEQACTTLINNEAACQRTESGEHGGATLFAKLYARQQAAPTDRMCRLRQRALLQGCATCFECGESARE